MNYKLKQFILKPMDLLYKLNPELELKLMFWLKLGEILDLKNPKTFNEKLQWIKLNYKNPLMPKLVDKYTVRNFVEEKGLKRILNELYWEGFNANHIPFEELPEKYVIKVTHGSGFNIIVTDKSSIDKQKIIKQLDEWLKTNFIPSYGEWFYGVEKPRIIIEKYLTGYETGDPVDYKLFCFEGIPKYIRIEMLTPKGLEQTFYDLNWDKKDYTSGYYLGPSVKKPKNLDEMIEIATKLSHGFPHVRVDLLNENGKITFGEMTFTNGAGFNKIKPREFDLELGSYLNIEKIKTNY